MSFDTLTTRDGELLELEADRALEETRLPLRLVEVLREFAAAQRLGRKRERFPRWFRIFSPEASAQTYAEWVKANPERAREISRDYYHRHPERMKVLGKAKRKRQQANPESHAKRLASYRAYHARKKAAR